MTRDELVTQNMDKVDAAVGHVLKQFPEFAFFKDDLVSAGYLGLVEAAEKVNNAEDIPAYLYSAVENAVKASLVEEGEIRVPQTSKRRLRKRGEEVDLQFTRADIAVASDHSNELYEEILACCVTDDEKIVVGLKRQGYTQEEIEEKTGIPQRQVSRSLEAVEERLKERSRG